MLLGLLGGRVAPGQDWWSLEYNSNLGLHGKYMLQSFGVSSLDHPLTFCRGGALMVVAWATRGCAQGEPGVALGINPGSVSQGSVLAPALSPQPALDSHQGSGPAPSSVLTTGAHVVLGL